MKHKKILIISIGFITSMLIVLVFLLNYNKNKLIDSKIYRIVKITNVGTTPAVIAECSYENLSSGYTVRCFKLKSNYNYKVKLPQKSLLMEGENINYKKYGNAVFHREELEIDDIRDDIGNALLERKLNELQTQLEDIKSQINGSDEQLGNIQSQISDIMFEMGL